MMIYVILYVIFLFLSEHYSLYSMTILKMSKNNVLFISLKYLSMTVSAVYIKHMQLQVIYICRYTTGRTVKRMENEG